jgi:phage baseplate assembly protein W
MAYKLISVENQTTKNVALGISYQANNGVFTPVYTTNAQAILNLKTLLLTRVGERYGFPEYGTFLLNVIFQPITNDIKKQIEDFIIPQVNKFLSYITIERIDVVTLEDDPTLDHLVTVTINFTIDNINTSSLQISANEDGTLLVNEL